MNYLLNTRGFTSRLNATYGPKEGARITLEMEVQVSSPAEAEAIQRAVIAITKPGTDLEALREAVLENEALHRFLAAAKELKRINELNQRFRGWDKDIAQKSAELLQLADKL